MAEDPTIQLSLPPTRECPTCGNTIQLEDKDCSLCGTVLSSLASPQSAPALQATVAVPSSEESSDATVITPVGQKPVASTPSSPVLQATGVVPPSEESADATVITLAEPKPDLLQAETVKAAPPPVAAPVPLPVVAPPSPLVVPAAPPPAPSASVAPAAPPVAVPMPPPQPTPVAAPVPPPPAATSSSQVKPDSSLVVKSPSSAHARSVKPQTRGTRRQETSALTKWGGIAAGIVGLFLVSFFTAKLFLPTQKEQPDEPGTTPVVATLDPGTKTTREQTEPTTIEKTEAANTTPTAPANTEKTEAPNVVPSPQPTPPTPPVVPSPPQFVGRITTADQLMPIRLFGAEPNDAARGVSALRTLIEKNLTGILDLYTAHLKTNPQSFGVVVLEFSVAPEGQVTSPVLHTTGNAGRELEQAVVDQVKGWQFPPAQGEAVKVFYPLLLSPEKIDPATLVLQIKDVWPGRYKVLAATPVAVHTEANDNAPQVGAIGPGLFLSVVSAKDGWLGALSPKGKVGYVRQDEVFPRVENVAGADGKG